MSFFAVVTQFEDERLKKESVTPAKAGGHLQPFTLPERLGDRYTLEPTPDLIRGGHDASF